MRRDVLWLAGIAVLTAGVTGGATFGYYRAFPPGRTLPGTYVGGELQPEGVALGAWLEQRRQKLKDRRVFLQLPEDTVEVTLGQLGVELDVPGTMKRAREHAEGGRIAARVVRSWSAREGEESLDLVWAVDQRRSEETLKKLAPEVYREPINAKLDLTAHVRIDDEPGAKLDVAATVAQIGEHKPTEWALYPVLTSPVPATITSATLAHVDVTQVLGAFETKYKGVGRGRGVNVHRAAEKLEGVIIAPRAQISFNKLVGPRTLEAGFTWAPVIVDDELTPGVGGGTCQVASTLFAAAIYGDLKVLRRRSHSRPSGYTPLGLDATVIYGEVDLVLENPYDTPLIIHAYFPRRGFLRVEILGREPPKVDYSYGVSRVYDTYRRVKTKPWMSGRKIRRQRGKKGYDVFSVVKVTHVDGRVSQKRYHSGYRPVPEVFWIGPGYDIDELPTLPKGAKKVEVDGVEMPPEMFAENPYTDARPSAEPKSAGNDS